MSEGPIKREREAWKPREVSTGSSVDTVHALGQPNRAYCGRKTRGAALVLPWSKVTCSDCLAAREADRA